MIRTLAYCRIDLALFQATLADVPPDDAEVMWLHWGWVP